VSFVMFDKIIYCLACRARTKLSWQASSNDLDLRRIHGHENVLDYFTTEFIDLGYDWNSDDTYLEDTALVENEPVKTSVHILWTDQVINGAEDDWDLGSYEDSDDPNCEESSDDSESDSADSFEGYDRNEWTYDKYTPQ
jgi:hypothetical protein